MNPEIDRVLHNNLDEDQFRAATDPAKEVLTLACAGSGKSTTLAFRIARLLAEGEQPDNIVAFTFTEKAADAIKLRVAKALTEAGLPPTVLGAMFIGTIHSYCQGLLGEMDARYRQFDVLDDNRLKLYLISRYLPLNLRALRSARGTGTRYFDTISQVADAWKLVNDEMLEIADVIANDNLLGTILQQLGAQMNQDQFIDFSLMIRLVADALSNHDIAATRAAANLRHLMVDEYQDINPAQETVIRELHALSDTLFVVGDDDQSIYAWRGADVSNILTFQNRYPQSTSHTLSINYRSSEAIVRGADKSISEELGPNRINKSPSANTPNPIPLDFRNLWFGDRTQEADWVAERIQSLLGTEFREKSGQTRGLTPGDFAVMMRSTRAARRYSDGSFGEPRHAAFTSALTARNIPFSLEQGGSAFERPQVGALLESFELLRYGSPIREEAERIFNAIVLPSYPSADFPSFTNVLTEWGRLIHAPFNGTRRRVYPQRMVHELLHAFGISELNLHPSVMQEIGVFSKILEDVETVYLSIDSAGRYQDILNFLQNIARSGYDTSTDDVLRRPDAVTVSTVHRMKGLEFPVVFVVDVEATRFPPAIRRYDGWLPQNVVRDALARGAYRGNRDGEARLFYTALTRAENYLHVTGSQSIPETVKNWKPSPYSQRLTGVGITNDPTGLPAGLVQSQPIPRVNETIVPTSYSDIRYYLRCPRDYQYRKSFGFSPSVPDMFGFGKTVHTSIEKLHEAFPSQSPSLEEVETTVRDTFHLKHVFQSGDPESHPGPYERARNVAVDVAKKYVSDYSDDFVRQRQVEARFEIPVENAVISGNIDLMLKENDAGEILEAQVIDFKSIEGGDDPEDSPEIQWTELALQVQLYAKAANDILGENAQTGAVHLLKDNQRIEIPIDTDSVDNAVKNVEWVVDRIIHSDFPMRPDKEKCASCDFSLLCPQKPEGFATKRLPPPISIPGKDSSKLARAFSEFDQ